MSQRTGIAVVDARGLVAEGGRLVGLALERWRAHSVSWSLGSAAILCWVMAWNVGKSVPGLSPQADETRRMITDPGVLLLMWTKGGGLALLLIMVLSITRPMETGVDQLERVAVPRAWQWPLSRWMAAAAVLGILTMVVAPVTWHVAHLAGVPKGVDASRWAMAGRLAAGLVLVSLLVAGFAVLVRSTAVTVSLLGLWFLLGEEILGMSPVTSGVAQWLPLANLWHFVGFELSSTTVPGWSPMTSGLLLAVAALVFAALGAWRTMRT